MGSGKLRIGIVGKRGLAFVSGFRAVPEVEVTAFCERDAGVLHEAGAQHGIPQRFTEFDALLEAVDAVVVATPMPLHVPQSVQALQAGKHVLSEVTAAISLDECWRLLDAVQASGKTYMLAENYCCLEPNVLIREMTRQGLFGTPYFGEGEYLHEVRALHHHPHDGSPTWRAFWQVGVNGCTYGTHSLGPVMQWFKAADPSERIATVTCLGAGRHTDPAHPHDDTTLMLCQLHSGKLIKIRLDMLSNRPHLPTYYSLQGTLGVYEAARFPGEPGRIWLGENKPEEHRPWQPLSAFESHLPTQYRERAQEAAQAGHGGGDYHIARAFAEAVRDGSPSPIDIFDALEWTAAGLCSQISIAHGGLSIRLPDFRDPTQRPLPTSL